ncbi:PGPGW domain-containing protein [Spirillospora sp. NPDC048819]|uniref:PGPGW domain-containing protein n=1 Tax=Spirillospora sp. NPDC048819 TaxID=3155268 RepID=UPI0033FEA93E
MTHRTETEADPAPRRGTPVRLLRKIAVAVVGFGLIVAGIAMLVLPGPGIVAILAGLGLLGTEFPRARRISERLNGYARTAWHHVKTKMPRGRGASKP